MIVLLTSISTGFSMAYSVVAVPYYEEKKSTGALAPSSGKMLANLTEAMTASSSSSNYSQLSQSLLENDGLVRMDSEEISWFGKRIK